MTKYEPLTEFLTRQRGPTVTLNMPEVCRILGQGLPRSAYEHRPWWSNQTDASNRPQSRSWQRAGYLVDTVFLGPRGWVRFELKRL